MHLVLLAALFGGCPAANPQSQPTATTNGACEPAASDPCDACIAEACSAPCADCATDATCAAADADYGDCLDGGSSEADCVAQYVYDVPLLQAYYDCVVSASDSCATTCGTTTTY